MQVLGHSPEESILLNLLEKFFPDSSKSTLRAWISDGRVFIDGVRAKSAKCPVSKGQEISLRTKVRMVENHIPILYEDSAIIVIDKPEGLLSVSTVFEKSETAHAYLKRKYYPRSVYVVHRLDQETSGVMIFALSEVSLERLKKKFETHDIERRYTAIVEGKVFPPKGFWKSYLHENANYVVKVVDDSDKGELAITHYEVKASNRAYTQLELTLETGKKNQIRVHCQYAGHPVVGDKKYGSTCNPLKRLGLHAHHLSFSHPMTGKKMSFSSPLPASFTRRLNPKEPS